MFNYYINKIRLSLPYGYYFLLYIFSQIPFTDRQSGDASYSTLHPHLQFCTSQLSTHIYIYREKIHKTYKILMILLCWSDRIDNAITFKSCFDIRFFLVWLKITSLHPLISLTTQRLNLKRYVKECKSGIQNIVVISWKFINFILPKLPPLSFYRKWDYKIFIGMRKCKLRSSLISTIGRSPSHSYNVPLSIINEEKIQVDQPKWSAY